jgi:hypothetical protein
VGAYVGIREWLQCDDKQLTLARQLIDGNPDPYNGGWAFPANPIGRTNYVFYGADIPASGVDWFLNQLRQLAALPASDEDDDRFLGLFLTSHEVDGMAEWQGRDGRVIVTPPPLSTTTLIVSTAYASSASGTASIRRRAASSSPSVHLA